jgi:hypothetical protein
LFRVEKHLARLKAVPVAWLQAGVGELPDERVTNGVGALEDRQCAVAVVGVKGRHQPLHAFNMAARVL